MSSRHGHIKSSSGANKKVVIRSGVSRVSGSGFSFHEMARKHSHEFDEYEAIPKQAVSLARRMAGKKGAVVQLQAEVNSEEDWEKLLGREGLIVVDVYSDWCGPCVGMVGNLKKVKLEIGGDFLHLAIAKADEIEVLKRFRNKSEPTWMFIAGGQLLNVMFGANAPRLMQLIEAELKTEQAVQKGEIKRKTYQFDELTPEEQTRAIAIEQQRAEEARQAAERELAARNEERDCHYTQMIEALLFETVAVCLPHTIADDGSCQLIQEIERISSRIGVVVADSTKLTITPKLWEEITYRENIEESEDFTACLSLGPCFILLLHMTPFPGIGIQTPEAPGDIERLMWECINMNKIRDDQVPVPDPDSLPAKYFWMREVEKVESTTSTNQDGFGVVEEEKAKEIREKQQSEKASAAASDKESLTSSCGTRVTNVPGVFLPISTFSKCAAVAHLFPTRAEKISVTSTKELPSRIALIFETDKADECFALADTMAEEIIGIGYFDKADPDEAVLLANTQKQYSKLPQNAENKLVVVVAKRHSQPVLNFAALGPIYVSPDETVGALESDKFFPPGIELGLEGDKEEEELSHSVGGDQTPTTAVTSNNDIQRTSLH